MDERLMSAERTSYDDEPFSLRPKSLKEFIGQDDVKEMLDIFIRASKKRKESLDHVLFYGPPGLGKTTLANILAHEMDVQIKITSGHPLRNPGIWPSYSPP